MKKDGFIFVESIIVLVIVALSVAMLISSYSLISRKIKEKENYDKASDKYLLYAISKLGSDDSCNYSNPGSKNDVCRSDIVDFAVSATNCNLTKVGSMMGDCAKEFEYLNIKHLYVISDVKKLLKNTSFPNRDEDKYCTSITDEGGTTVTECEYLYTNGVIDYLKTLKSCNDENKVITTTDEHGNTRKIYGSNSNENCENPIKYLIGEFERQETYYYAAIEI